MQQSCRHTAVPPPPTHTHLAAMQQQTAETQLRLCLRCCCYCTRPLLQKTAGESLLPLLPSLAPKIDIPVNAQHMNERLGQLVMLHLGEAVIGFAASPLESTRAQFVGVALAATLVWSLHLCYFHVEPDRQAHGMDLHAYRQNRARGLLFFYCHWLLVVALLLTGSSLRLLLGKGCSLIFWAGLNPHSWRTEASEEQCVLAAAAAAEACLCL